MSGLLDPHDLFCQVLQGFMFLGHVEELGGQVASAFTNAVNTTVVQVTIPSPIACHSTSGTERLSNSAVLHLALLQCNDHHANDNAMQYDAFLHSACVHGVKKSQRSVVSTPKRPCICTGGTGHVNDAPRL